MSIQRSIVPLTIASVAGMVLWISVSFISGKKEAWDANVYWTVAYPVAIVLSGLLGLFYPKWAWRWPLALFVFQFVGMVVRSGELGNLWPLGLLLFIALSVPGILAAQAAAWLRARLKWGNGPGGPEDGPERNQP
jgi:peptidoglycan/LPS O-acetylase OafA/YrhL